MKANYFHKRKIEEIQKTGKEEGILYMDPQFVQSFHILKNIKV